MGYWTFAVEEHGGFTIRAYAEVLALLRHFPADREGELLARLGISAARWEEAMRSWSRILAEEAASGADQIGRQFGEELVRASRSLVERRTSLDSIGRAPEPPGACSATDAVDRTCEVPMGPVSQARALPFQPEGRPTWDVDSAASPGSGSDGGTQEIAPLADDHATLPFKPLRSKG